MTDPILPLTPAQVEDAESRAAKENFLRRDITGLDQFVNVLTGGKNDETISARSARAAEAGKLWGRVAVKILNIFQSNHGPRSQAGDLERAQAIEKTENNSGGFTQGK